MVELIADPCFPSDLGVPQSDAATANAISGTTLISGLIILDKTGSKLEFWNGTAWETITSVVR